MCALAVRAEVLAIALDEMLAITIGARLGAIRHLARAALLFPAASLARSLTSLDHALARGTLRAAALATLRRYGVELGAADPVVPSRGPVLVVSNHPGLFDALALFASVGRDDLATLAARRRLLDALPNVRRRLLTIEPGADGGMALRLGLRHLRAGGALLHFPAGQIEPDPRMTGRGQPLLGAWRPGIEVLLGAAARAAPDTVVVPAIVSGVISPRAHAVARAVAGRDGPTDAIVPLLQLTLPGFRDAEVRVHFGEAVSIGEVQRDERPLRAALERLAGTAARSGWAEPRGV